MGISRKSWPDDPVWAVVDAAKLRASFPKNLSFTNVPQLVREFYKKNFWDRMQLDRMGSQEIADKVFDLAVNASAGVAVKILQRTLNALNRGEKLWPDIKVDGVLGDQTIETTALCAKAGRLKGLLAGIRVLHGAHYFVLMEKNERLEEFALGWLVRAMA